MSWGERSCKISPCPMTNVNGIQYQTDGWAECNVNCKHYQWDGHTPPDSKPRPPKQVEERATSYNKPMAAQGLNRAQRRAQAKMAARLRHR